MEVLLTSGIIVQSSRTITLRSFSIVSSIFTIVSSETNGHPKRRWSWTSIFEFSARFVHMLYAHSYRHRLHSVGNECPTTQFFAHKKLITELNSPWRRKRVKAPSLMAAKFMTERHTDSLLGWGLQEGSQATHQCYQTLCKVSSRLPSLFRKRILSLERLTLNKWLSAFDIALFFEFFSAYISCFLINFLIFVLCALCIFALHFIST